MMRRLIATTLLFSAISLSFAGRASAFMHMVSQGETLAQIAIRVYGSARFETVLVGANALDAYGGSAIAPGMRIEILAPGHHRVTEGETWPDLALSWLGDAKRAEVLAGANGAVSWVPPSRGQEIEIPAVLSHLVGEGETMPQIAQKYLGDQNHAWELEAYNNRKGGRLARGDLVLVPLSDLALTEAGKKEAREADKIATGEGGGTAHDAQRRAEAELPPLLADVRGGRYVDAVVRGNRILGSGDLTKPQLATVHRALLEAYVALDAPGAAAGACAAWRANAGAEGARLDPRLVSPKIRQACTTR